MDEPLTIWYCDVCREPIEGIENGYVIWQTTEEMKAYNFKIIHHGQCDIKEFGSSSALKRFIGSDGQGYLLTFLSLGPIKIKNGETSESDITDYDEFIDFFRRVQTPYYEEARRTFHNDDLLDRFSDANQLYPYLSENLKNIVERYSAGR